MSIFIYKKLLCRKLSPQKKTLKKELLPNPCPKIKSRQKNNPGKAPGPEIELT